MHAVRGRLHLHTDEHGFAPGIADGLVDAVFLDVFADVQPGSTSVITMTAKKKQRKRRVLNLASRMLLLQR